MTNTRNENLGYVFGLIAVVAFAFTLPATRVAVRALDPVFVGLGRGVGAALLAAAFLFLTRQRLPSRSEAKSLIIVAAGVVVGAVGGSAPSAIRPARDRRCRHCRGACTVAHGLLVQRRSDSVCAAVSLRFFELRGMVGE